MKRLVAFCIGISSLGFVVLALPHAPEAGDSSAPEAAPAGLKLENLLSAELESAENTEIIVSRVTVPPNTSLPKHWHPGEEFAYVLEGTVSLWLEGETSSPPLTKGDVARVPLKRVHTAMSGDEGATLLVFRVHETGQPERVLVD